MNSNIVSRELLKVLKPVLRKAGWSSFTGRTARRFSEERVDVINFQSFNSYLASSLNCTTYSFVVNLGCFLKAVPYEGVKICDNQPMPQEYQCHLRRHLNKKLLQPEFLRKDIFYVDEQGEYLPQVIDDVLKLISTDGSSWFDRFSDMREVLRTLKEDNEDQAKVWGFGSNPSPHRYYIRGYVAMRLGETKIAVDDLRKAALSPSYSRIKSQIEKDISDHKIIWKRRKK